MPFIENLLKKLPCFKPKEKKRQLLGTVLAILKFRIMHHVKGSTTGVSIVPYNQATDPSYDRLLNLSKFYSTKMNLLTLEIVQLE